MFGALVYIARVWVCLAVAVFGSLTLVMGLSSRPIDSTTVIVGVVLLLGCVLSWPRRKDAWRKDPPTQKQLAYAASLGILVPPGASKGEVSDLISAVAGR